MDALPHGATTAAPSLGSIDELRAALNECRRCALWKAATQGVPGEGGSSHGTMLIGEAPGDAEDEQGHPFVGPAGALLDRALQDIGLDRKRVYITNAVKHFKFERRGKRRLHMKPGTAEIQACRWWLQEELRLMSPRLVIAMGATAARAILGKPVTVTRMRGAAVRLSGGTQLWITVHPSYLLRIPQEAQRRIQYERFVEELRAALSSVAKQPPA